jgi:hypothetical protein
VGRRPAPADAAGAAAHNWPTHDGAHRTFTEDFATNLLQGLPPRAVLFTWGDNDTFPLMFAQAVLHVRPDVQIVNVSLSNAPWYVNDLTRRDPSFPLPSGYADSHGPGPWTDTTLTIPVAGTTAQLGLPAGVSLPRSIAVRVAPTTGGKYILLQDLVLLQILENNRWRRPLCFSTTGNQPGLPGLAPYARLDGLFWRLVPLANPSLDPNILRANLLETYRYRGYADPNVPLDEVSRGLGLNYYPPLVALAQAEYTAGGADQCRRARERVLRDLPLSRLQPDAKLRQEIEGGCATPKVR